MSVLEIKSLSSPDVDVDVWEPTSNEEVYFLVEVEIGERNDERCDLFQLVVATPEGLRKQAEYVDGDVVADRATLVLSNFSWRGLWMALKRILEASQGNDWSESLLKLQRYMRWEYEDYVQESAGGVG